jgi:hypothetical protein
LERSEIGEQPLCPVAKDPFLNLNCHKWREE